MVRDGNLELKFTQQINEVMCAGHSVTRTVDTSPNQVKKKSMLFFSQEGKEEKKEDTYIFQMNNMQTTLPRTYFCWLKVP